MTQNGPNRLWATEVSVGVETFLLYTRIYIYIYVFIY